MTQMAQSSNLETSFTPPSFPFPQLNPLLFKSLFQQHQKKTQQQQQTQMASSPVNITASSDSNPNINNSQLPQNLRLVKIRFVSQVHKTIVFQVKGHVPLQKVVDQYFDHSSLSRGAVDLIYKGHRLNLQSTPNQLGMKNDVKIEVMVHVHGGGMKLQ